MRLGIIGAGIIVQEFLPKLMKLDGMEVVGVQGTPNTLTEVQELCRTHGVPHGVATFEELCETDIDTVYVAVPNFLHFTYCKQALEKGIHVIVEKPMTSNWKEAKVLEKLAEENNCFIFEAVTTLYLDSFAKIKEWLPRIGTIKIVQSQYSQYSRRYDAFRAGQVLPAFDSAKSGGALMDLNLYNMHMVMGLFGEPVSFQYYANVERGIDTSGILTMQYPDFQALCLAAKDCRGTTGTIIQGTDGYIETSLPPNIIGNVTLKLNDGTVEAFYMDSVDTRLIPEFTAFMRAINENDREFYHNMLDKSLAVSRVQTEARLGAGIIFPTDKQEL